MCNAFRTARAPRAIRPIPIQLYPQPALPISSSVRHSPLATGHRATPAPDNIPTQNPLIFLSLPRSHFGTAQPATRHSVYPHVKHYVSTSTIFHDIVPIAPNSDLPTLLPTPHLPRASQIANENFRRATPSLPRTPRNQPLWQVYVYAVERARMWSDTYFALRVLYG